MRSLNHFSSFVLKKGAYFFVFLLSIPALLLSVTTLFTFYPLNPPTNTFGDQATGNGDSIQVLDTIIEKLVNQIRDSENSAIGSDEPSELQDVKLKHRAFLADALALLGTLKLSLAQAKEEFYQQERLQTTGISPLSRSNQSL